MIGIFGSDIISCVCWMCVLVLDFYCPLQSLGKHVSVGYLVGNASEILSCVVPGVPV